MPLSNFMTATATTKRGAKVGIKFGAATTHLESVKITPIMLPSGPRVDSIRKALGLDGGAVQVFEVYTESHLHTDDSSPVTQVPDIVAGDRLITDGTTYTVRTAEVNSATSGFGQTLIVVLTESRRE